MDAPATRTDAPLAHGATGAQHGVNVAPAAPIAAISLPSSQDMGHLVGVRTPAAPPLQPAAEHAQPEQAQPEQAQQSHSFDFSKLEISETDAPTVNAVANHLQALGGNQQHAELAAQVVQRMQQENDKADAGMAALIGREMRNQLGAEYDGVLGKMMDWVKGQAPSIQNDLLSMMIRSQDGFRTVRNWSEAPIRDVAEPALGAAQPTAPTATPGTRAYWQQLREIEARQPRDDRLGRVVGAQTRGFAPSR